ncbi:MAG: energy-coupling factor ABC transporter ATP-binding protein [Spirochaetia bacterium]|nr:energy-coupling factor ABC transporter ATP-binding protein [Spirochaetia bacterium]
MIEVHNLTHSFLDGTTALREINLTINKGEFILCAGRNGSGKTVFSRHLNALYQPSSGWVKIDGRTTAKDPFYARRTVGLVFQDADSQIVGQTVRQDIAFGPQNLRLSKDVVEKRVESALQTLDLYNLADHRPHQLSGGEKRRLAIASVIAMEPAVVVFDEPFSNLDYPGVQSVLRHIVALHQSGHTVLLVTHDIEKAAAHADRMVIFDNGKIAVDTTPQSALPKVEFFGIRPPRCSGADVKELTWLK